MLARTSTAPRPRSSLSASWVARYWLMTECAATPNSPLSAPSDDDTPRSPRSIRRISASNSFARRAGSRASVPGSAPVCSGIIEIPVTSIGELLLNDQFGVKRARALDALQDRDHLARGALDLLERRDQVGHRGAGRHGHAAQPFLVRVDAGAWHHLCAYAGPRVHQNASWLGNEEVRHHRHLEIAVGDRDVRQAHASARDHRPGTLVDDDPRAQVRLDRQALEPCNEIDEPLALALRHPDRDSPGV